MAGRVACASASWALAWLVAWVAAAGVRAAPVAEFELRSDCPPSFERGEGGVCRLRSLYERYGLAQGHGGTQVGLPPPRQDYTAQQIDLGRYLFFDAVLSADGQSSCAHCHHPDHGLSDGRRTAAGFGARGAGPQRSGGQALARRTPSLWNVGFAPRLFWDGRAASLEEQAAGPLFSAHEMGSTPATLEARLNANPTYRRLFRQAFAQPGGPGTEPPIDTRQVAVALAAFESTLVSLNSRYDRYAHGDRNALNALELQGLNTFRGFVARCSQCHTPPLFTNGELAVVGAPPVKGQPLDVGAGAFSDDPRLRGAFKVPTLRNITRSGPYFNAGQFRTLDEVLAFYNAPRGHALPRGEKQAIHWHVHMLSRKLDRQDERAIVAFLGALEDESLLPEVPLAVPSGLPVVTVKTAPFPTARAAASALP